jgi:hypothetical protein
MQTQVTDDGHDAELGYESAVDKQGLKSVHLGRHKGSDALYLSEIIAGDWTVMVKDLPCWRSGTFSGFVAVPVPIGGSATCI